MKRVVVLLVALISLVCVSAVLAQNAVPFRGTVDMPVVSMGKDTVVFKPMGLGSIRSGIADLQDLMGDMEDAQRALVASFNRHDERVSQPVPVPQQSDDRRGDGIPYWWAWVILAVLLGLALQRRNGRDGQMGLPGRDGKDGKNAELDIETVRSLVRQALAEQGLPSRSGGDDPWLQLQHMPEGTEFTIKRDRKPEQKPTETTSHTVEEIRMSPETGAAIEGVVRAIGEALRKPEQPKPPTDAPAAS